ncbi:MAG: pantoate--beta-alanine ligase [Bacillota bacterium]
MQIITSIQKMQTESQKWQMADKTCGFVATMGYLHQGHLSLLARAKEENDYSVVSIFVNPLQFAPTEDFAAYPRDQKRDRALCEKHGADYLFIPEISDIYPEGFSSYVTVDGYNQHLCGMSRPDHFRGVTTIVNKLFNICRPDRAYFGQKDIQQLIILRKMTDDLNIPLEICAVPTLRDPDGLAISSRNVYLSDTERKQAPGIYAALLSAQQLIESGERDVARIIENSKEVLASRVPVAQLEYLQIVDGKTLNPLSQVTDSVIIAVAVRMKKARLIDNIILNI